MSEAKHVLDKNSFLFFFSNPTPDWSHLSDALVSFLGFKTK